MTLTTFTEDALPYCVFSRGADGPRVGAGLGTHIIDLERAFGDKIFAEPSLNSFMARGPRAWQRTRERLLGFIRGGQLTETVPIAEATLHLPFEVATSPTSTPRWSTRPTRAGSSARTTPGWPATGGRCRSATTAGPAPWW